MPHLGADLVNLWQEVVQPVGDAAGQLLHVLHAVQNLRALVADLGHQLFVSFRQLQMQGSVKVI